MKLETTLSILRFILPALGFIASIIAISNLPPEKSTKGLIWFILVFVIFTLSVYVNSFLLTRMTNIKVEELEIRFQANTLKTTQARIRDIQKLRELGEKSDYDINKNLATLELKEVGKFWALSINPEYGELREPREGQEQWFSTFKVNYMKGLKTNNPYGVFSTIAREIEMFNNVFGKNYTIIDLDEIIEFLEKNTKKQ